jgi:hypothetical protein
VRRSTVAPEEQQLLLDVGNLPAEIEFRPIGVVNLNTELLAAVRILPMCPRHYLSNVPDADWVAFLARS